MYQFVMEIFSSDLESFARKGYGADNDTVQKMLNVARNDGVVWRIVKVTADQLCEMAQILFYGMSPEAKENFYEVTNYQDEEQAVVMLAEDIMDECCKAFIDEREV